MLGGRCPGTGSDVPSRLGTVDPGNCAATIVRLCGTHELPTTPEELPKSGHKSLDGIAIAIQAPSTGRRLACSPRHDSRALACPMAGPARPRWLGGGRRPPLADGAFRERGGASSDVVNDARCRSRARDYRRQPPFAYREGRLLVGAIGSCGQEPCRKLAGHKARLGGCPFESFSPPQRQPAGVIQDGRPSFTVIPGNCGVRTGEDRGRLGRGWTFINSISRSTSTLSSLMCPLPRGPDCKCAMVTG